MGIRGPAPKPTAIRKREGYPSSRRLLNEPFYPARAPTKPDKISAGASVLWDDLVEEMSVSGVLCSVDGRALWHLSEDEALLANAYEGLWNMARSIKREAKSQGKKLSKGEIMVLLTMKNGRMAMNALHNIATRVIIERREFGLTPASRTRIDLGLGSGNSLTGSVDPLEVKLCARLPS